MQNWDKKIHVQSSLPAKEGQYVMFVGRWQPLHKGHQSLFQLALDEGKNILICIRDIQPDEKNPYSAEEVKANIETHYLDMKDRVKVIIIPDICSIEFGRGVGYNIIERIPPQEIHDISSTKIREELRSQGKI
jgi:cytidyltransferase-like protein